MTIMQRHNIVSRPVFNADSDYVIGGSIFLGPTEMSTVTWEASILPIFNYYGRRRWDSSRSPSERRAFLRIRGNEVVRYENFFANVTDYEGCLPRDECFDVVVTSRGRPSCRCVSKHTWWNFGYTECGTNFRSDCWQLQYLLRDSYYQPWISTQATE